MGYNQDVGNQRLWIVGLMDRVLQLIVCNYHETDASVYATRVPFAKPCKTCIRGKQTRGQPLPTVTRSPKNTTANSPVLLGTHPRPTGSVRHLLLDIVLELLVNDVARHSRWELSTLQE